MNKHEKFKEFYEKLKEDWKNPRKKAGIKLLGYLIFFLIFILLGLISGGINSVNKKDNSHTTTTKTNIKEDKYKKKQEDLLTNKYAINYVININNIEYKINGTINNNYVEGYLEFEEDIKKIVIKEGNIFEIKNNEEILLELDIYKNLIDLKYIINLIKQNSALIEDNSISKKYTYNINDNIKIIVETDEDIITKINISEESNVYSLSFDK